MFDCMWVDDCVCLIVLLVDNYVCLLVCVWMIVYV